MRSYATWDTKPFGFATDSDVTCPVMVCSHERSGTHFLINSIAKNSLFRNDPYLNYDAEPLGSFHNFHDVEKVQGFFERLLADHCASIIKSHFAAPFFIDDDGRYILGGRCKVIYIIRHPLDVMISYYRFVHHFPWREGPKPMRAIDFAEAAPEGRMMRYQNRQVDSIIDRWQTHILAWLAAAAANPDEILVVRYQDLDQSHAAETKRVLAFLGCEAPDEIKRPDPYVRTVHVPPRPAISHEDAEAVFKAIGGKVGSASPLRELFPNL